MMAGRHTGEDANAYACWYLSAILLLGAGRTCARPLGAIGIAQ